jgi:cyclohexyl-isocyanide hydratase
MADPVTVAIPVFPGVDLLDIVGPYEVLSWLHVTWPGRTVQVQVVGTNTDPLATSHGLKIVPDAAFGACPAPDVLVVPGGPPDTVQAQFGNKPLMDYIRSTGPKAQWVCSICTGALLLAKAGLLEGYQATTHWGSVGTLRGMGVRVANGYPRYVLDGNRVTGGGISSGLDASLALVRLVTGDPNVARRTQLMVQYHPQPDYDCGDPDVADSWVLDSLTQELAHPGAPADAVAVWKRPDGRAPAPVPPKRRR